MAAAIALALLIALVPGRLGQFLCLGLQQFVEGFLYTASYQLLQLALDYFSFGCTIFPTWFAVSFQNGVSQLHSARDLQTMSLLSTFQFAKLILPYQSPKPNGSGRNLSLKLFCTDCSPLGSPISCNNMIILN